MKRLIHSSVRGCRLNRAVKENVYFTVKAIAILAGGYVALNAFFALILLIGYVTH